MLLQRRGHKTVTTKREVSEARQGPARTPLFADGAYLTGDVFNCENVERGRKSTRPCAFDNVTESTWDETSCV